MTVVGKDGLQHCKRQTKITLHKAGQFLLRPLWNYLPDVTSYRTSDVVVVLTTTCNANCIFCPYQFLPKSERIDMPDIIFSSITKNIKRFGIPKAHLTSTSGEPLIAPNFLDKVKELRLAGVRTITLTTNGILLDYIGIDKILESVDIITISTTAFDTKMYERIYRSNQFVRVHSNIMNMLTRNRLRSNPRYISIRIRPDIPKEDVLAMPETQKLIDLVDELYITEAYDDWGGLIKPQALLGTMRIKKGAPIHNRPCQHLTNRLVCYPNGDILACGCRHIHSKEHTDPHLYLGNIMQTDFRTALNKITIIAANWRNGKIPQTCRRCTMYGDPAYYWPLYFRNLLSKYGTFLK